VDLCFALISPLDISRCLASSGVSPVAPEVETPRPFVRRPRKRIARHFSLNAFSRAVVFFLPFSFARRTANLGTSMRRLRFALRRYGSPMQTFVRITPPYGPLSRYADPSLVIPHRGSALSQCGFGRLPSPDRSASQDIGSCPV